MRALAAVAVLVALLAAGCGSDDRNSGRRAAVDDYLRQVNLVQKDASPALATANNAFNTFWSDESPRKRDADLRAAIAAIRSVRARVVALQPPADARELHRRLVRLLGLDVAFAVEVRRLGAFLPGTKQPLAELDRANRALQRDLGSAKSARSQAVVLDGYTSTVDHSVLRLQRLGPPRLLAGWHEANLARMRAIATSGRTLARTLRGRDPRSAQLAGWEFRKAVAATASSPQLLRSALIAYNARVKLIRVAVGAVNRERNRLQRSLQ